jgi:hypothetical protein
MRLDWRTSCEDVKRYEVKRKKETMDYEENVNLKGYVFDSILCTSYFCVGCLGFWRFPITAVIREDGHVLTARSHY